jgi:ubiquinone/menaquinone biosynthesis C-methylase UbiE
MDYKTIVDEVNRRAYTSRSVLSWYQDLEIIQDAERTILEKITARIRDKRLLDISMGGGRTTALLLPISRDYVGIDYASDLVDAARRKFPQAAIICRDARDLTCFDDASFDFVLVSNNGLDYMVHEDRITVMQEIFRVLNPQGLFMFSTHNRDYQNFDRLPWQQKHSFEPGFLKNCAHALYYLPKHLSLKKHARQSEGYAIINDNAHGYSLLTYYISIERQIEQLAQVGFVDTEAYDFAGTVRESDTTSPWIYYLTRKQLYRFER